MSDARWSLAARLAARELRAGLGGFRIFIASLALGVGAIAAVGSVGAAVTGGLRGDARELLGSDVELERVYQPIAAEERAWLDDRGFAVSESVEIRTMARPQGADAGRPRLVEVKSADALFPFYGAAEIEPAQSLADGLAKRAGADGVERWGVLFASGLASLLKVEPGDVVRIGEVDYAYRGDLIVEPGRGGSPFALAPRAMVAHDSVPETKLIRLGSLIEYEYGLRLPAAFDPAGFKAAWTNAFPDAGFQIRDFANASPGVARIVQRVALFLTLVGLTALLVGGLGVSHATRAFLAGRARSIATLKCVGAPNALIFRTYLLQILALATLATAIGLALGVAAPWGLAGGLSGALGFKLDLTPDPAPLALAAVFGLMTALAFAYWPLARARAIPAARLFRDATTKEESSARLSDVAVVAGVGLTLAALVVLTAVQPEIAAAFIAGAALAVIGFRLFALAATRLAKAASRNRAIVAGRPGLRQALANLHRPGAATPDVILALGVGLTVLAAIAQIETNLADEVERGIPDQAPSFYFIDVQTDQRDAFKTLVAGIDGAETPDTTPMIRGRITAIKGVPAAEAVIAEDVAWAIRGDRGLTYEYELPSNQRVARGAWWPRDYDGPPLVSMTERMATGFAMAIGDTVTLNVLGRNITAKLAATRDVDWGGLQQNFTFMFAPGVLEKAPHAHIATVKTTEAAETAVFEAVTDAFPNVSVIPVREALTLVNEASSKLAGAVRVTAGVTLVAGVLVLAGAIAAGHRRRVYEAVVMKVLGATRGDMLRSHLTEFGALGLITATIAAGIGIVAGWAVVKYVLFIDFSVAFGPVAASAGIGALATLVAGAAGSWTALGRKAAPLLRNE